VLKENFKEITLENNIMIKKLKRRVKMKWILLLALVIGCQKTIKVNEEIKPVPSKPIEIKPIEIKPVDEPTLGSQVRLWATWYHVPLYKSQSTGHYLRDKKGNPISPKVSLKSWCFCAMEGTCKIDNTMYNYAGTSTKTYGINCKQYFNHSPSNFVKFYKENKHPFGVGNRSNPLTPHYSLACDQSIYKFGQEIFIPESKSPKNPRGIWRCDDVGGKIKGNHIDVFIGTDSKSNYEWIKSKSSGTFNAYLIQ
jgi:3D (Asp-Asp-Asp) domain-containing protein